MPRILGGPLEASATKLAESIDGEVEYPGVWGHLTRFRDGSEFRSGDRCDRIILSTEVNVEGRKPAKIEFPRRLVEYVDGSINSAPGDFAAGDVSRYDGESCVQHRSTTLDSPAM